MPVHDGLLWENQPITGAKRASDADRLIELLPREPRVQATAVQTVGSKGYDGFLLARVR